MAKAKTNIEKLNDIDTKRAAIINEIANEPQPEALPLVVCNMIAKGMSMAEALKAYNPDGDLTLDELEAKRALEAAEAAGEDDLNEDADTLDSDDIIED